MNMQQVLPLIHDIISVEPKPLIFSSPLTIFDFDISSDLVKSGHSIAAKKRKIDGNKVARINECLSHIACFKPL